MKKFKELILVIVLIIGFSHLNAQDKRAIFIGIQPAFTKEKFYEKNEFDINVIPIVIQTPISNRMDLRFVSLANYHFGNREKFSDIEFQLLAPWNFTKKETSTEKTKGFYLAPVLGFGKNLVNYHYTTTVALEPGFTLLTDKRFSLAVGIQLGASYFSYDDGSDKLIDHFGVKVQLGLWNKSK